MSASDDRVKLHLEDPLFTSESRATSMSLPVAIHRRLDQMAKNTNVMRSSRGEIVAMLIATTELDPSALADALLDYRRMSVAQALPGHAQPDGSGDVVVPIRRPGRPKRAG